MKFSGQLRGLLGVLVIGWLALSFGRFGVAQDEPAADVVAAEEQAPPEEPPAEMEEAPPVPREDPADRLESKRRAYTTGVMMLGGIIIAGVGLIAIVLIWGGRARRIARQPLPSVSKRDELWYLKNKPEKPSTDEPSDNNNI